MQWAYPIILSMIKRISPITRSTRALTATSFHSVGLFFCFLLIASPPFFCGLPRYHIIVFTICQSAKKKRGRGPSICIACPSHRLLTMPSNAWPHCVNDRNCHCRPAHSSCCKYAFLILLSKNSFHLAPHGREPCRYAIILLFSLGCVSAAFWQRVCHLATLTTIPDLPTAGFRHIPAVTAEATQKLDNFMPF